VVWLQIMPEMHLSSKWPVGLRRLLVLSFYAELSKGRTDSLRIAKDERCTARYAPAKTLDQLVWQDLCAVLADPDLITHELQRAQAGEWLPQALQSRRQSVKEALAQLERQQARLLEVFLAEIISRDEFERKRQELNQTQQGLSQQMRQLELQAQRQINTAKLATHIQDFCQRIQPTLDQLDFAQRRQLVELLIDRVIVDDASVEIRYVIPTSPKGEESRFCHLRKDYFIGFTSFIGVSVDFDSVARVLVNAGNATVVCWRRGAI
jgi:site-specific DNA recombinase